MAPHRTPGGGGAVGQAAGRPSLSRAERQAALAVPVTTGWTAAGLTLVATLLPLSLLLPSSLALVAAGCLLATAGFAVAAALLLSGRRLGHDGTAGWDFASALVFLGFAAVLLTDMGEAMAVLTGTAGTR